VDENALTRREVVIDHRAGDGGETACANVRGGLVSDGSQGTSGEVVGLIHVRVALLGIGFGFQLRFVEGGEDVLDPAGGKAGVGVDVRDELAGGGGETGLAGEGEAFARLVDDCYAGVAEGDFTSAVGAGVVDDDDLGDACRKVAGLIEDGLETGRKIGLFVVRGNDEAKAHMEEV
jgi:hypothetical protein